MRGSHDGSSHTHPLYRQPKLGAPFKPFFGLSGIHGSRPGEVDGQRQQKATNPVLLARVLFNAFSKLLRQQPVRPLIWTALAENDPGRQSWVSSIPFETHLTRGNPI